MEINEYEDDKFDVEDGVEELIRDEYSWRILFKLLNNFLSC